MKADEVTTTTLDGTPMDWEGIVAEHSARVYRLAYRLSGNRQDAEDLTQDVFIRVFRSLDSYEPGNFPGWLHRITTNLFLDRVRRKSRLRMDGFGDGAEDRLLSHEVLPESAVHDANFDPDIEKALASLSDEFRVAVVLCDIEGLSYEEIADVLGIKLGTVRSRIHRGRTQLRETLAHRAPSKGRTRFAGPVGA
ncbi:RNA polymerase sigma factor SigE [Aeromicrobium wangtongii]|uniref:RNA polymerase sigma factor SigE n=1 Tax=Aeromicrobium wangtongii TaxID=2969247 RepID=A0ABY5M465_9ACTN|nr:RNA polymerase sigma factor SigE [Aeromicrobium wangtongii]MCD9199002.1 RNA polymerase sigma factor SigE [Aeromicrobium wangtongii]MCL3819923.1 RNA polymerase sigma factor SigE [Aeromicrobium wangtongii]UUP12965.1 RNA polymerase sigma factor SigE [Aeromicrobium wangtongii]